MNNIVSCSFGKDSIAQIIVMKELGIPIDDVMYCDIRFDDKISGEHPMLAKWIPEAEDILYKKFGVKVTHITAPKTFTDYFYTIKQKGNHIGEIYGFPYTIGAWCNSRLKLQVIDKYLASINGDITQFVGIAYDEPQRYESLIKRGTKRIKQRSILFEQKIIEQDAYNLCKENGLLSPHYSLGGFRGGCWFCVKQSYADLHSLWTIYPELFYKLVSMEKESFNSFLRNSTLAELEKRFKDGYVPIRRHRNAKQKQAA